MWIESPIASFEAAPDAYEANEPEIKHKAGAWRKEATSHKALKIRVQFSSGRKELAIGTVFAMKERLSAERAMAFSRRQS